jgi:Mg-chelatase subunit ChlD
VSPPPSPSAGQPQKSSPKSQAAANRTVGRSTLARHARFAEVSPEVGVLDREALERALAADPDGTLALVADLVHATDEGLRADARRLAARLVLDRSRSGRPTRTGTARPRAVRASRGGDLDIDASLDAVLTARGERRPPDLDELTARDWGRQDLAVCLLVDASGSMSGERLAVAATVAAACALRAPVQHAVLAFAGDVRTLRPLHGGETPSAVVDRVLALRGHGVTRLADALREASAQLAAARARRRVVVLLSDCRHTDEDPVPVAASLAELVVLAPRGDSDQAAALASAAGASWAELAGADSAPGLLRELLG